MVTSGATSFDERLGRVLVEGGFVTPQQLDKARQLSQQSGVRILDALINQGFVSREAVVTVLSFQLKIPVVDLRYATVEPEAARLVPEEFALQHSVLPLGFDADGSLRVATLMPHNFEASSALSSMTGRQIKFVFAMGGDLKELIERTYAGGRIAPAASPMAPTSDGQLGMVAMTTGLAEADGQSGVLADIRRASALQAVEMVTLQAVKRKVSDVHLRPTPDSGQVLFRLDGVLQKVTEMPLTLHESMVSRIKVLARMDISETRRPQDGSFTMEFGQRKVDFRVSTLGSAWGEFMVVRVLDREGGLLGLEDLGLHDTQLQIWRRLLALPYGLLLVAGPTGSGKSTTLYASVMELVKDRGNIVTVEDPIEYRLEDLNQIQVNRAAGIEFATTLRSVMRLDPDVILIGEIRDSETAKTAVDAALTGHLVLASIHSHDAASAIVRLLDLEAEPFLVATSAAGVLSQRLVRKVCDKCGTASELGATDSLVYEQEMQESSEVQKFMAGQGCNFCFGTGYSGRTGVFEVFAVSDPIRKLIGTGAKSQDVRAQAIAEGMVPLRRAGLLLAKEGVTTVKEVLAKVYTLE
ncbi:MAG: type II/IV secretion system protein [Chloroflexi bacterium]|nr:type II/IV secretion system protein [Chloroflexota bacterium]